MTASKYGRYWNVTLIERAESFECDSAMDGHTDVEQWLRAIDADAPVDVTYRWLCQFKIAPYSYDWIDNIGRRSPKTLTAGACDVAIGQRFLVFRITAFAADDHITGRITPGFARLYGELAVTYQVRPRGADTTRVVVALAAAADSTPSRLRRRQLLNLRKLAEGTAGHS